MTTADTITPDATATTLTSPGVFPTFAPSDPANFRDLGGIVVDGGTVATATLFRSDDLCLVSAGYAEMLLRDHGITAIIDLRSAAEVAGTGRGPLGHLSANYHHLALGGDVIINSASSLADLDALAEWYTRLLELSTHKIVTAISIISVEKGATVFHCAAGKDRTGILAAAILALLGADADAIAVDYARTHPVLENIITRLATSPGSHGSGTDVRPMLSMVPRPPVLTAEYSVMLAVLALVVERHGSIEALLRTAGLDDALLERLRARLLC